jgi:hypothetical protein
MKSLGTRQLAAVAASLNIAAALIGCSGRPSRVAVPDWDPPGIVERAMTELDANDDGRLDAEELREAPGLAAGMRHIDEDGDGAITAAELESRLERIAEDKLALRGRMYRLTHRGRPITGADVRFEPEPFLGGVIETASGASDDRGVVHPTAGVEGLYGLRTGFYRMHVETVPPLPASLGPEVVVGVEVGLRSDDDDPYGTIDLPLGE